VPALRPVGSAAAFLVAAMLVIGALGLVVRAPGLGLRNWLVVLFQLNSGVGQLPDDALRLLNPLDLVILVAVGIAYLGLWPGPVRPHRFWMVVATVLPFAGIVVLLVTGESGRSAVMNAGIVVAVLLAVGREWLLAGLGSQRCAARRRFRHGRLGAAAHRGAHRRGVRAPRRVVRVARREDAAAALSPRVSQRPRRRARHSRPRRGSPRPQPTGRRSRWTPTPHRCRRAPRRRACGRTS